jgi:FMN phosphatase YigB (HAD superfamily)
MNKAFVFDFDDTLAKTDCKVLVRSVFDNSVSHYLTPSEYNTFDLPVDQYYDYSQFSDAQYIREGQSTFLMDLAKEVHDENHDVYILTARGNAIANSIDAFLKDHGIEAKQIHCVGDSDGSIAKEKSKILLAIMQGYDRVYFYDDDKTNVETAKEIGVKSYQV